MTDIYFTLDSGRVRDISGDVLGDDGRLKVMPAEYYAGTTREERALFGHRHGLYSFPTVELVEYLKELIGDRRAIEIGAGHGVLADALGIPGTDSFQQRDPKYRAVYEAAGQPIVPYGPNVVELDAWQAVRRFRPKVVIGCWVTHKYERRWHLRGGNEKGVQEERILDAAGTYVTIGNDKVHEDKPLLAVPHEMIHPDWLYSRAVNGTPDFIAQWG